MERSINANHVKKKQNSSRYGLNVCVRSILYPEALTTDMMVFGDGALRRSLVRQGLGCEALMVGLVFL